MIRKGFDSILNKALESTELAKRVAELERMLAEEHAIVQALRGDLEVERTANREALGRLSQVEGQLAQRDTAVHDLVIERDNVLQRCYNFEIERNEARKEREEWFNTAASFERQRNDAIHAVDVATERAEQMARQVAAIKQAFQGLMSL